MKPNTPNASERDKLKQALSDFREDAIEYGEMLHTGRVKTDEEIKADSKALLEIEQRIVQLITTYTESVAKKREIDARIEENEMYLNEANRHYFESGLNYPSIPLQQFTERITKLQKEQSNDNL